MTNYHWRFVGVGELIVDCRNASGICSRSLRCHYLHRIPSRCLSPMLLPVQVLSLSPLQLPLPHNQDQTYARKMASFHGSINMLFWLPNLIRSAYFAYTTRGPLPSMILRIRAEELHRGYPNWESKLRHLCRPTGIHTTHTLMKLHGGLETGTGTTAYRSRKKALRVLSRSSEVKAFDPTTCIVPIGQRSTVN